MSEQLVRPNGKRYHPRQAPSVVEFCDYEDCTRIAVLRTHDVALATELAQDFIEEYELDPTEVQLDWWHLVPWDTGSGYDRNWVTDTTRGIPCVVFPEAKP